MADARKLSGGSCGPVLSREIGGFADAQSQSRTVLERVMVINKLNRIFVEGLGVKEIGLWKRTIQTFDKLF